MIILFIPLIKNFIKWPSEAGSVQLVFINVDNQVLTVPSSKKLINFDKPVSLYNRKPFHTLFLTVYVAKIYYFCLLMNLKIS